MKRALPLLALGVALVASTAFDCPGNPGEGEGEGEGNSGGEGEGEGNGGEGEGQGLPPREFACGTGGTVSASSACNQDADCAAVFIEINCCGTSDVTGVSAAQATAFQNVVATCDAGWPPCGCATQATTADDGTTGLGDQPAVACVNGACTTTFPGAPPP